MLGRLLVGLNRTRYRSSPHKAWIDLVGAALVHQRYLDVFIRRHIHEWLRFVSHLDRHGLGVPADSRGPVVQQDVAGRAPHGSPSFIRHGPDMLWVGQEQRDVRFEDVPHRLPVDAGRFQCHDWSGMGVQPRHQLQQTPRRCADARLGVRDAVAGHGPHARDHLVLVNVQTSTPRILNFHATLRGTGSGLAISSLHNACSRACRHARRNSPWRPAGPGANLTTARGANLRPTSTPVPAAVYPFHPSWSRPAVENLTEAAMPSESLAHSSGPWAARGQPRTQTRRYRRRSPVGATPPPCRPPEGRRSDSWPAPHRRSHS